MKRLSFVHFPLTSVPRFLYNSTAPEGAADSLAQLAEQLTLNQ